MWQRFTERARKVIFYAQEEAQRLGEGYVSTEHILLGILREGDSAAEQTLKRLGMSVNRIRTEVEKQLPKGNGRPTQDMTLTPRAKRIIDLAYDEARKLGNNYIGTEHLLLGLIREADGLAGRILRDLGVELDAAREAVKEIQAEETAMGTREPSEPPKIRPKATPSTTANPPSDPWEGFDPFARRAIVFGEIEALRRGQQFLSPEHLLLGLLRERESPLVRFLPTLGLDPEALAEKIAVRCRDSGTPIKGEATFSPATLHSIKIAYQEQVRLRAKAVGAEHLFLGLLREPDGIAARLLEELGLDADLVRAEMVKHAWRSE